MTTKIGKTVQQQKTKSQKSMKSIRAVGVGGNELKIVVTYVAFIVEIKFCGQAYIFTIRYSLCC